MSRTRKSKAIGLLVAALVALGSAIFYVRGSRRDAAEYRPTLEEEIQDFVEAERMNPPATGAILFTGSSSIRRWETLELEMHPLPIINRGFGGSQLEDLVRFHAQLLGNLEPAAVVVYAGDNDLDASTGKTAAEVLRDFQAFAKRLWETDSELPVFYLAIKPSPRRWSRWPEMRDANQLIAGWCAGDARLTFVDVAGPLLSEAGSPLPELFLEDRLHLNRKGYSVWGEVLRPVLLEALSSASNSAANIAE